MDQPPATTGNTQKPVPPEYLTTEHPRADVMAQLISRHLLVPLGFAVLVSPAILLSWFIAQSGNEVAKMIAMGYHLAVTDLMLAWLVFGRSLGLLRFPAVLLMLSGVAWALSLQFPPKFAEWFTFLVMHAAMVLAPLYQLRFQGLSLARVNDPVADQTRARQFSLRGLLGLAASAALIFLAARWMAMPQQYFREVLIYCFGYAWVAGLSLWAGWHPRAAVSCSVAALLTSVLLGVGVLWVGGMVDAGFIWLGGSLLSGSHSAAILLSCFLLRSLGWVLRGWPGDNNAAHDASSKAPSSADESDKNLSSSA